MEEVGGGVCDVKMRWDVPAGLSSKGLFSPSAAPISMTTPLYMRDNGDASSATPFWQSFGKVLAKVLAKNSLPLQFANST